MPAGGICSVVSPALSSLPLLPPSASSSPEIGCAGQSRPSSSPSSPTSPSPAAPASPSSRAALEIGRMPARRPPGRAERQVPVRVSTQHGVAERVRAHGATPELPRVPVPHVFDDDQEGIDDDYRQDPRRQIATSFGMTNSRMRNTNGSTISRASPARISRG